MQKQSNRYQIIGLILLLLLIIPCGTHLFANPIYNYDYHNVENEHSPAVIATGGLNVTNPFGTHTANGNPALLVYRKTATIASSFRLFHSNNNTYDNLGMPPKKSLEWKGEYLTYLGFDTEKIGFNYHNLVNLNMDHHQISDSLDKHYYSNYYLNAYKLSIADSNQQFAMGLSISFLSGRMVYLSEQNTNTESPYQRDLFIDSRGLGYAVDLGAATSYDTINFGMKIPNVMSKVYWKDQPNKKLDRKIQLGIQWGDEQNFVVSGLSRKFDFKSKNTYHLGIQQNIRYGVIGGIEYYVPLRVGINGKSLINIRDNTISVGTGYEISSFQIDVSYSLIDVRKNYYSLVTAISFTL
ncbi:MAG: hypothetical protein WCX83_03165 [Candidatus Cloacimonas sp.]